MNKFLSVLVLSMLLGGCTFINVEVNTDDQEVDDQEVIEEVEEVSLEENILAAFEVKYTDMDYSGYTFDIQKSDDTHAFGYSIPGEDMPGGWWYAAEVDGVWVIAQDGNGDPQCSVLEEYGIPIDWYTYNGVQGCY